MALTDKEIIAAAGDWKAWGHKFGWELIGLGSPQFDETQSAAFHRNEKPAVDGGMVFTGQFTITKPMREDIDRAMKS